MATWWKDEASEQYVCGYCDARSQRDVNKRSGVRRFMTSDPEALLDHFQGHRDHPVALYGDFLSPEPEPLDPFLDAELEPLWDLAIAKMSYDESCETLAEAFLQDYSTASRYDRALLARDVQRFVEGWLEEFEHNQGPRD